MDDAARLEDLLRQRAALDREIASLEKSPRRRTTLPVSRGIPVRERVIGGLGDLGTPAFSREIAAYRKARYGDDIESTRFGPLGVDERKKFVAGRGDVLFLCYALTYDRFEPIKRLLARSDFPLHERIFAPTTGKVQHLRMTVRLCELAMQAETDAVHPGLLRTLAAEHADALPGVKVRYGQFELQSWHDRAVELLDEALPEDQGARRKAAIRLAKRPEIYQLFGVEVLEGQRDISTRHGSEIG